MHFFDFLTIEVFSLFLHDSSAGGCLISHHFNSLGVDNDVYSWFGFLEMCRVHFPGIQIVIYIYI
jgi:hypothetical protein